MKVSDKHSIDFKRGSNGTAYKGENYELNISINKLKKNRLERRKIATDDYLCNSIDNSSKKSLRRKRALNRRLNS